MRALEKQGPVTHVGHEQGGRHGRTRPDAAPAAKLVLNLTITVTLVVGALVWMVALMLHVL
ncbi:MAG: hypothetical protein ACRDTA_12450 [Pseudonocardiaceae bacterium]